MGITDAFRKFGAKLKNTYWSISAENDDGELVVSLWEHYREVLGNGRLAFNDRISRFSSVNPNGSAELMELISKAFDKEQTVRVVIAKTSNPEAIDNGEAASNARNTFNPKLTWVGRVTAWDGDNFRIEFTDPTRK